MKIGISSLLLKFGENRYKKLREAGFDCLDMNLSNTDGEPYSLSDEDFVAYFKNERRLASEAGISFFQIHGPWQWPLYDRRGEELNLRMKYMKMAAKAASIIGAKHLVIHPVMPNGIEEKSDTGLALDTFNTNIEFLKELAIYAESVNVTVCLENMPFPKFSLSTPKEIADVIYAVDHKNLKMCLDTGHAAIFEEWQPSFALKEYKDIIKTVHIHDNRGKNDDHLFPFVRGCVINWNDFSLALKETGFDGVFNFECEPSPLQPDESYLAAMKAHAILAKCIIALADEE